MISFFIDQIFKNNSNRSLTEYLDIQILIFVEFCPIRTMKFFTEYLKREKEWV